MKRGRDFFPVKNQGPFFRHFCKMQPRTLRKQLPENQALLFSVCTLIRLADQIGGKTHCLL